MTIDEKVDRLGRITSQFIDACVKEIPNKDAGYIDIDFDLEDNDYDFLVELATGREMTVQEFLIDMLESVIKHAEEQEVL